MSFASISEDSLTGSVGDFTIYSLPKFFPISFGGILQCNDISKLKHPNLNDNQLNLYSAQLLTYYLEQIGSISTARLHNFEYLKEKFGILNFQPFFEVSKGEIPGVFMFRTKNIDLGEFKIFMQSNGVESSVFYGEEAFFVPIHQELTEEDMDFFYQLTLHFMRNGDK